MSHTMTRTHPAAPKPARAQASEPLLRAAPGFVQALTMQGRPFVMQDVEPYSQFWLSERERLLLALFARRGGARLSDAAQAYMRLVGTPKQTSGAEKARVASAVAGMLQAGVLMQAGADTSRYSARIVRDYVAHRPFPVPVADSLVQATGIGSSTRVLDLAGGPGDLALALAKHSQQVTLMELSRGFLAAARARARQQGLALQTVHDSCNRLPWRDDHFDVITVSQALHWLDDVAVCRGVCRLLQAGGSFFVIHSAIDVPDSHPLAYLLGHDSILGKKARRPFATEVQALQRRLALLFEALDAPDVERVDPTHRGAAGGAQMPQRVGFAGVKFFDQQRPFDAGYARGFLTPQHIAMTGRDERRFWADLNARCAAAPCASAMQGVHHWAVLHFQRGARAAGDVSGCAVHSIAYEPA
jgi:SAM-dependent methyltransferase